MRKLERRAWLLLGLALLLFTGLVVFVVRFVEHGDEWAMKYYNRHIYVDGHLATGKVYDRHGELLADNTGDKIKFNDDSVTRYATAQVVGDGGGFVSTGAETAYKDRLVGYDLLTGTYNTKPEGNDITLSIKADLCKVAYNALGSREGLVAVYNYKTGQVVCMTSTPSFDPADPPAADDAKSGTFMNKFLSGNITPGSIFKLVTSAAAIEEIPDQELRKFSFNCDGVHKIKGSKIRCTQAHGKVNFKSALAQSCNGAFAELSVRIGADKLEKYTKKFGLEKQYNMDGIMNQKGSFEFPDDAAFNLAWAGIGQWKDYVNPCSMLVYLGAIARDGKSVVPRMLKSSKMVKETGRMMDEETAHRLRRMMKNNVTSNYGEANFPGLSIYAKSGTAEVEGKKPNAWFVGFIKNRRRPYAFVVCVENSGFGSEVAGPVANTVMQAVVNG